MLFRAGDGKLSPNLLAPGGNRARLVTPSQIKPRAKRAYENPDETMRVAAAALSSVERAILPYRRRNYLPLLQGVGVKIRLNAIKIRRQSVRVVPYAVVI